MSSKWKSTIQGWAVSGLLVCGYFGWQYFFPSHLNCDTSENKKGVVELVNKGYTRLLSMVGSDDNVDVPTSLSGELTNIQTIKKASNKKDTARCSAIFNVSTPGAVFKSVNLEYSLTGKGVVSSEYRMQIESFDPVMAD